MQRKSSTIPRRPWPSVALALALGVGCGGVAPPDFSVLRLPPLMSEEAEEQAATLDGTPLAEFGWACDVFGAYIEDLRRGLPVELTDSVE